MEKNTSDENYIVGSTIVSETSNHTLNAVWSLTASEFLQERKATQASCTVTAPNKSSFYGEIDADVIYYTGNDESCLKNYVWYSGKLWRIVAIYPNGMMKLVTENPITSITFGSDSSFNSSYVDSWLTNVFLSTLYNNTKIVVQNAEWNVKETTTTTIDPYLERLTNDTITKKVGLLNAYEYTKSGTSSGYLHIGQYWRLITPYDSTKIWLVGNTGDVNYYDVSLSSGVRPSIYLKSNVTFDTKNYDGTRLSPFHIKGDMEEGQANEFLNTRISGEYVRFDGEIYRIIEIEGTTTKMVKADYLRDNDIIITKKYGSDIYFDTASADDTYWDYYLPNTWFNSISSNYRNMIATNTSGTTNLAGKYYKNLCVSGIYYDVFSTNNSDYYYSKVGLLHYGEMFASQLALGTHINDSSNYSTMWLSTPFQTSNVWYVNNIGLAGSRGLVSERIGVRPTINLKSETKITGGSGFINDPYEIGIS